MDAVAFTSLIKHPSRLEKYSLKDLKALSEMYPYSQSFHLLLAKKAFIINDPDYESYLAKAAIHSSDRKKLYHLIHEEATATSALSEEPAKNITPSPKLKVEEPVKEPVPAKKESKSVDKPPQKEKPKRKPKVAAKKKKENKEPLISKKPKKVVSRTTKEAGRPDGEKHSFMEWLHQIKVPAIKDEELEIPTYEAELLREAEPREEVSFSIPRKVIEPPEISEIEDNVEDNVQDLAKSSLESKDDNVSETLASVYQIQKKYSKAIEVYERLILKYPNKKAYFAHKIENLKKDL